MSLRHLAAVALTAGALLAPAASATCYLGPVDICDKPTDPYTDPVMGPVNSVYHDVITTPAVHDALLTGSEALQDAYIVVLCVAGDYWYC